MSKHCADSFSKGSGGCGICEQEVGNALPITSVGQITNLSTGKTASDRSTGASSTSVPQKQIGPQNRANEGTEQQWPIPQARQSYDICFRCTLKVSQRLFSPRNTQYLLSR